MDGGTAAVTHALMISAPASGQGKTSVTAAIARHHARLGQRVRVFKAGPDFLDPMWLERASGHPVFQLDLFMGGMDHCRSLLAQAAREADLILVEGVMGLYDGDPCSADLARAFRLPVLAVIDASAMAQTFGAVAHGLATYQPGLSFAGVVANRVGGARHAQMVAEALPAHLPLVAALGRDTALAMPERHLGLVQAMELPDAQARLDRWADVWSEAVTPGFAAPRVMFEPMPPARLDPLLAGVTVAIARDTALSFVYRANVRCLEALGAGIVWFSPLRDAALPPCDAVWLPGGYPELYAAPLSAARGMAESLRAHDAAGKPLLAECGGLLYLLDTLVCVDGTRHPMAGVLPGEAVMHRRLAALGPQTVHLPEGTVRGHTFHYSSLTTPLEPMARATSPNGRGTAEAVYRRGRLTASYVHTYFPSNPDAIAAWFLP